MFQKIGGILSKNQSDDDAELHKAVHDLNQLLNKKKSIASALLNPHLKLKHVQNVLMDAYRIVLQAAKYDKVQAAQNRSLNDSYVPDEYDELLTVVEIQGHITAVNYKYLWQSLCKASQDNDIHILQKIFTEDWVKVKRYNSNNIDFYCDVVKEIVECNKDIDIDSVANWHKVFQNIINEGNTKSLEHTEHKIAIANVNMALEDGTPEDLYAALINPHLELNFKIDKYAVPLLFEEMKLEKYECGKNLNESEIAASLSYLTAVAAISQAVDKGDDSLVWSSLNSNHVHLDGLRPHCRRRYLTALSSALQVKKSEEFACSLLTLDDIRDAIEMVNMKDDINEECKYEMD